MKRNQYDEIRILARGCWANILADLGVDSHLLDGKNHPCPACGGNDRFQFNIRSASGAFSCRSHPNGGGDGFELLKHVFEIDFSMAASRVASVLGMSPSATSEPVRVNNQFSRSAAHECHKARRKATDWWQQGKQITTGDAAGLYLNRRCLVIPDTANSLRFHPALPYWKQADGKSVFIGNFPALLARIVNCEGKGAGLHRIYLESNGEKLALDGLPAKKIHKVGELRGGAVRLAEPLDSLWVTEGVEDALAVMSLSSIPAWAAVSAGMMPFVQIPETVRKIFIGADNDAPGQKGATALANRLYGEGRKVWIHTPPKAKDWNDEIIEWNKK